MTKIFIGNNGYIEYNLVNNRCYNIDDGSINITNIVFDNLSPQYLNYSILWSSQNYELDSDQIRNNAQSLTSLKPDNYYLTIESLNTNSSLGPYTITVSGVEQFGITKINYSSRSCDSNGRIFVEVSGGSPPYSFVIGVSSVTQNDPKHTRENLDPLTYNVSVFDSVGCLASNLTDTPTDITIKSGSFDIETISVFPPLIIDSYGRLDISINGHGPFNFYFSKDQESYKSIDFLDTSYLTSYDENLSIYSYSFNDILTPGTYSLTITNSLGCSITTEIAITNINPITANIDVQPDYYSSLVNYKTVLPILDTIFIPYKHIKENSDLWKYFKKCFIEEKIHFEIDNIISKQTITRMFLTPRCINNNIEVLRLGNHEKDWFFCFHISPGINLLNNFLSPNIKLVDHYSSVDYECVVGLVDNSISIESPSLLIGSMILPGSDNTEFVNNSTAYFSIEPDTLNINNNDIFIKDIKIQLYLNAYIAGYSTNIYFLENFNTLIENLNIKSSACSQTIKDWEYILNIKKLILTLNNFNNINVMSAYSKGSDHTGSISIALFGNYSFFIDNTIVANEYFIDYFAFDENSDVLKSIYQNNNKVENVQNLNYLPSGFFIIRIRDANNNKVKYINNNNISINYDNHFASSINFLKQFNNKIVNYFTYGDILVYLSDGSVVEEKLSEFQEIPQFNQTIESINGVTVQNSAIPEINFKQSGDTTNTSKLKINVSPINTECYLLGPKNYKQKFVGTTIFNNVVPGVYTIIGNDDYLYKNTLYNNYTKIIILDNQDYTVNVNFISYINKTFIKE